MVSVQGNKQWARHAALRGAGAEAEQQCDVGRWQLVGRAVATGSCCKTG